MTARSIGQHALLCAALASAAALAAPAEKGQTFDAGGATLYFEVLGDARGAPLVVVNGGPSFDPPHQHPPLPGTPPSWGGLAGQRRPGVYLHNRDRRSRAPNPGPLLSLVAPMHPPPAAP